MNDRRVIQIIGPYRAPTINRVRLNIEDARNAMVEILKRGHYVICPHTMTAFLDGLVPEDYFIQNALRLMKAADAVYLTPGWRISQGSQREISWAHHLKLRMYHSLEEIPVCEVEE